MQMRPVVQDGSAQRQFGPGDTLAGFEVVPPTNATATNLTITGLMLAQGIILRSPAGVSNENIDTAANIVAAISAGLGTSGIQNGLSWRVRWIENAAFALTVQPGAANTGVTVNRGTVAATSAKDFLVTIVNGTPAQTFSATTVNANAVLSGFTSAQIALLSIGMVVLNAQAGQQGNTIIALNSTAGTVTMSGNSNATNAVAVSFQFSPVVVLDGLAP